MASREEKQWQHYRADKVMRHVRKQIKRNRKPKGEQRRDRNWDDLDNLDELDLPQSERVMPRGEQERRRTVLAAALESMEKGDGALDEQSSAQETGQPGVVLEVSKSMCRVDLGDRSVTCGLRGSLSAQETGYTNVVAVGDQVIVSVDGSEQGSVDKVLPRRSVLARPDVFRDGTRTRDRHLQQVIVANADQLLIVASWRAPTIWLELIDRYLIAAERHNLMPIICVNKVDLAEDVTALGTTRCHAALRPYQDLGYRVIFASAVTGAGVSELRDILRGRTTALAGMSGVGKSSLLQVVQPGLQLRIGEVSEHSLEGRHTTAQVTMLKLEMGGFVVDTPGVREFGLSGLSRGELIRFYPEIAAVQRDCRFGNCSHLHEPGCAVQAAVRQGRVSKARYRNYEKIYLSLS